MGEPVRKEACKNNTNIEPKVAKGGSKALNSPKGAVVRPKVKNRPGCEQGPLSPTQLAKGRKASKDHLSHPVIIKAK